MATVLRTDPLPDSKTAMRQAVRALVCLVGASLAMDQGLPSSGDKVPLLRGELETGGRAVGPDLTAELYDLDRRTTFEASPVSTMGAFQFQDIPLGRYEVRIARVNGALLAKEFVRVESSSSRVQVRLAAAPVSSPEGTVPVARLGRSIPAKAAKAFREAQELTAAGDATRAMEKLRKALDIHPLYSEAYTNLGSHYARGGEPGKAIEVFERAIGAGAADAAVYTNLAVAYLQVKRPADAEAAARQALTLDPRQALAHHVLGKALVPDRRRQAEALDHLRLAVSAIPEARLAMAQVHAASGATAEAVRELRAYLQSGSPRRQDLVESWIAKLEAAGAR
ncbi:MAG: tetratricopeptide repeat protein [Acidobacteria bacterium]|nr:tetratricopeptide repeat protein [Acidobacteriota bacterium]